MRSGSFFEWVAAADFRSEARRHRAERCLSRSGVGLRLGAIGHNAGTGQRQRADRAERLDIDGRDRACSPANACDEA